MIGPSTPEEREAMIRHNRDVLRKADHPLVLDDDPLLDGMSPNQIRELVDAASNVASWMEHRLHRLELAGQPTIQKSLERLFDAVKDINRIEESRA